MSPGIVARLTPLASLRVSSHCVPAHGGFPNSSLSHHPLLIYHGAFNPPPSPSVIEQHLSQVGVVRPAWRYTMYRQHHYHSTTHEVLVISRGSAKLCFGGGDNPNRLETIAKHGDVIVVPAGVAHGLLEDLTGDFEMVGSYPLNCEQWDMCVGAEVERKRWNGIQSLSWFSMDPIYGREGPVLSPNSDMN